MNIKTFFILLNLVWTPSQFTFAQSEEPNDTLEAPLPTEIFPSDIEKSEEDNRRYKKEMREYEAKIKARQQKVEPE